MTESHIDQWHQAQVSQDALSTEQDEMVRRWLEYPNQWTITLGDGIHELTYTGELVAIGERDHIGPHYTDPSFTIEFPDPSGFPMSIKAHFARFEPVEE